MNKKIHFNFIKENTSLFEYAEGEIHYINCKKINCEKHVALFLDVFRYDGFNNDYQSDRREWVLLPQSVADNTHHIKVTFDGTIIVEDEKESKLLATASVGYDDVSTPQIFFLGQRTDYWHNLNTIAKDLNSNIDYLKNIGVIYKFQNGTYLINDSGFDEILNHFEENKKAS